MDIKFNKNPGEIVDVFLSLSIINNREADKKDLSEVSFKRNEKIEEAVDSIIKENKVEFDDFQLFFCEDIFTKDIFTFEDIWNSKNLEDYLNFINNLEIDDLRKRLVLKISKGLEKLMQENYTLEEIASSNYSFLKYIRTKKIDTMFKWEIYSILNHKEDYMEDFIKFIHNYLEVYKEIEVLRKAEVDSFNEYIEDKLSKEGLDYLNQLTNNSINFKKYNKVHVSTSVFSGFMFSSAITTNDCYIIIGSAMREGVKVVYGKDEIEKNLSVFKGISDSTRFSIIKLLLEKDYYGLELAEAIGISNAAVSYHLTSLVMSGIVTVEKGDHRCYYSLNKNKLTESIKFLYTELQL